MTTLEVILSLGAINTPKVLMQSGIGDQTELARHGIPVIQHLPGVGQNFQDHPMIYCVWESPAPLAPQNTVTESVMYWSSGNGSQRPDFFACQVEFPLGTPETARFGLPESGWTFGAGISHPKSRGRVSLTGPNPLDPSSNRSEYPVRSGRLKGRNSECETTARSREFRLASSLRQAWGHAG